MNTMIEKAKTSRVLLPVYILPFFAYAMTRAGLKTKSVVLHTIFRNFQMQDSLKFKIQLVFTLVYVLYIFLWVKLIERRAIRTLGLSTHSWGRDAAMGAALGSISFCIIVLIGSAFGVVTYQSGNFSFINIMNVILMIPLWVLQAGTEEIVLRGWLLPECAAQSKPVVGIILCSVVFSALHTNKESFGVIAFVNIFLISVIFSILTIKTDSIWEAIMFHAFWNFVQGTFFGINVSGTSCPEPNLMKFSSQGNEYLSGGQFGIEASIITTVIYIIMLFVIFFMNRKGKILRKH